MSLKSNSISFIVPCFNEENNIKSTIKEIYLSVENTKIIEFEIIIIDDGSTDKTFEIISKIEEKNKNIFIIKNLQNLGLGGAIKKGLSSAKFYNVMFLPGDNCHKNSEIKKLITVENEHDLVLTYYTNPEVRNYFRSIFTKLYTPFLNFIFQLNLPYYNGLAVYKRSVINSINIYTNSFTWQIEVLLKLFKTKDIKYMVIPTKLDDRTQGKSKAFNFKNSIYVLYSIGRLFCLNFFLKKKD